MWNNSENIHWLMPRNFHKIVLKYSPSFWPFVILNSRFYVTYTIHRLIKCTQYIYIYSAEFCSVSQFIFVLRSKAKFVKKIPIHFFIETFRQLLLRNIALILFRNAKLMSLFLLTKSSLRFYSSVMTAKQLTSINECIRIKLTSLLWVGDKISILSRL